MCSHCISGHPVDVPALDEELAQLLDFKDTLRVKERDVLSGCSLLLNHLDRLVDENLFVFNMYYFSDERNVLGERFDEAPASGEVNPKLAHAAYVLALFVLDGEFGHVQVQLFVVLNVEHQVLEAVDLLLDELSVLVHGHLHLLRLFLLGALVMEHRFFYYGVVHVHQLDKAVGLSGLPASQDYLCVDLLVLLAFGVRQRQLLEHVLVVDELSFVGEYFVLEKRVEVIHWVLLVANNVGAEVVWIFAQVVFSKTQLLVLDTLFARALLFVLLWAVPSILLGPFENDSDSIAF